MSVPAAQLPRLQRWTTKRPARTATVAVIAAYLVAWFASFVAAVPAYDATKV